MTRRRVVLFPYENYLRNILIMHIWWIMWHVYYIIDTYKRKYLKRNGGEKFQS